LEYIGEIKVFPTADAANSSAQTFTFLTMNEIVQMPGHLYKKPIVFPFEFRPIAQPLKKTTMSNQELSLLDTSTSPPSIPSLPPPQHPSSPAAAAALQQHDMAGESQHTTQDESATLFGPTFIESFYGGIIQCRYYLKCTIIRKKPFQSNWTKELDIFITTSPSKPSTANDDDSAKNMVKGLLYYIQDKSEMGPINIEFGLDHYLHVQLHLPRTMLSLQDSGLPGRMLVVEGEIQFLMVRLTLIEMEVQFFVKEMVNYHGKTYMHQHLLQRTQIMEGTPGALDKIPFRLFLDPKPKSILLKLINRENIDRDVSIRPTLKDIHQKFSTRYYLNFILTDHESKKYFKQQEIFIVP